MATKKKSTGRLSSLFTSGFQPNGNPGLPPSPSPHRLSPNVQPSSRTHSREPSEQLLPPAAYPHNTSPILRKPLPHASTDNLTVPPAPVRPGHRSQTATPASSRPASAASSMAGSRPTTPIPHIVTASPVQLSPESAKDKPKKKGLLHKHKGSKETKAPAWILGSQTPYDMGALVNAQRVGLRE